MRSHFPPHQTGDLRMMYPNNLPQQWRVTLLKDEMTGALSYEFLFPVGDGTTGLLELPAELSPRAMARRIAGRTRMLPDPATSREKFVHELIEAASSNFVVKARQPGWKWADPRTPKPQAFVTPGQ